jgi:enamine deaminase RidA (YjgF/YER057c/UK114 family)
MSSGADVRRLGGDPPSPYEERYGFSRVVTAGPFVMVGGTTSAGEGGCIIGVTPYDQAVEIFSRLVHELGRGGAGVEEVVSCRAYVTDISRADQVARAFGEVFPDARPLFTMVEVSALIDPRMLVEIEAVAYLGTP